MSDEKTAAAAREAFVAALEEERRGYAVRGLDDRVKQVDAAIRAAKGEPKGRRSREQAEG